MLRIYLLGSIDLWFAGRQLQLPPTRKSQALLAYLIIHRSQPQSRDRLAELFWGDRSEEKARGSLSTALWHLHHCLPDPSLLLSSTAAVQFDPCAEIWLDTDEFSRLAVLPDLPALQSAQALYRGDFLDGFYDDWVLQQRYQLEKLYLDALAKSTLLHEDRQDAGAAIQTAQRLLAHDPLREDAHRAIMRACAFLGQRSAALEQYQRCRQRIAEELDAEPSPETVQLYQMIRSGPASQPATPVLAALQGLDDEHPIPQAQNPLNLSARLPCVGRASEMAFLHAAWQAAHQGLSGLALVSGEAGTGKTRLVEQFADQVRWKGAQVLWGRCYEFERILPYQPIAEAMQTVLTSLASLPEPLKQDWAVEEVARLAPDFEPLRSGVFGALPMVPGYGQTRFFAGIARFLRHLAQPTGLLLILEDLHWAADSTLELLHYLLRHLNGQPVLIVATLRIEEVDHAHPVRLLCTSLQRDHLAQELCLQPLTVETVTELVVALSGRCDDPAIALAQRLHQETEGNPFFLSEVIKALFERSLIRIVNATWQGDFMQVSQGKFPLPASLQDAILSRFARLEESAHQVCAAAAVIGREFDYELLNNAIGQADDLTMPALDILLRRGLVQEGSGASGRDYAFVHHKIQEVIYASLPRPRRLSLHAQIGLAAERLYAPRLEAYIMDLAHHFMQARTLSDVYALKAVDYLLQAGDTARLSFAYQEATAHYQQALEMAQELGENDREALICMKLGIAHHNAFEYEQAHKVFEAGFHAWQKSTHLKISQPDTSVKTLRMNWFPITSLDPVFAYDLPGAVCYQLFSGLVQFTPGMEVIPDTANKWELLADGREYIFHLKPGLRWSDGAQLTAGDFVFSGQRLLAPETQSPYASLLYDIQGARAYHLRQDADASGLGLKALDPLTLHVVLEKPAPYFLQLLANFFPLPRHAIATYGENWTKPEHYVGNGPFRIESYQPGKELILARNSAYHGSFSGNVHRVVLCLSADPTAQLRLYASDDLDGLDLRFYPMADFERAVQQNASEYVSFPWALVNYLGLDVRRPPFQDRLVRTAFARTIDKHWLAGGVQKNSVFPAAGGFIPPGLPGHSPSIGLSFDPHQAQSLLAQAGYSKGHGFPPIRALTHLHKQDPVNLYLAAQWREILGVDVTWETVSPGLHVILEHQPPHLYLSHWLGDYPDPDGFLGASQLRNWTGWQDPAYLKYLAETRDTHNQADRLQLFKQADRLLVASAAVIPLTYDRQHLLLKPRVRRYPTSPIFTWFWKEVIIS